jgi:hypothetical protein
MTLAAVEAIGQLKAQYAAAGPVLQEPLWRPSRTCGAACAGMVPPPTRKRVAVYRRQLRCALHVYEKAGRWLEERGGHVMMVSWLSGLGNGVQG